MTMEFSEPCKDFVVRNGDTVGLAVRFISVATATVVHVTLAPGATARVVVGQDTVHIEFDTPDGGHTGPGLAVVPDSRMD